jgi:predicted Zn-dependent protease
MIRPNVRVLCVAMAATLSAGLVACGGTEPEPQTAAAPPPPATTEPAAPPAPAEPNTEQRKAAARAAIEARDWARAKTELSAIVAKDPNDVEAQRMLAAVAEAQNDKATALEASLAAARADGGKDEILSLATAQKLYAARRYDDLVAILQQAAKANERSLPTHVFLGMAHNAKGDPAGAAAVYQKATATWPDEPQLWAQLALAQAGAGQADEAKKSAKSALEKWTEARAPKSNKDVKLGRGAEEIAMIAGALRRAGDPKGAESALARYVVPKDEMAPQLDVERGLLRVAQKDGKGAQTFAERAVKAGGETYAPVRLVYAGIAALGKKTDDARAQLSAWEQLTTDPSRYTWEKGWIEGLASADGSAAAAGKPDGAKTPAKEGAKAAPK